MNEKKKIYQTDNTNWFLFQFSKQNAKVVLTYESKNNRTFITLKNDVIIYRSRFISGNQMGGEGFFVSVRIFNHSSKWLFNENVVNNNLVWQTSIYLILVFLIPLVSQCQTDVLLIVTFPWLVLYILNDIYMFSIIKWFVRHVDFCSHRYHWKW